MPKKEFLPYKWELIVLLWFAFFFNQADRQAYNVVLPLLSADLKLSPVQAGLVASIFLWCYALLVPVAGYLGDISRRKWIVFWSLLVWSAGTILSGATTGLASLIVFRSIATGGGEAFYFPSANSLIGQYHHKTRAMAMSIHQTALYVGLIASGFIAGWIGEHFGWRSAFYVF
ncbi:MAG: MFS transporter, partial [Verrucomicrobiia bacterium]